MLVNISSRRIRYLSIDVEMKLVVVTLLHPREPVVYKVPAGNLLPAMNIIVKCFTEMSLSRRQIKGNIKPAQCVIVIKLT